MDIHPHSCDKLKEFNKIQKEIIISNLSKHKWYRRIQDDNQAIFSFINEFAGIMRQVYCKVCDHKCGCIAYKEVIGEEPDVPMD